MEPTDRSTLLSALVNGQLTTAVQEATHIPGKRVYQTNAGVRALTALEARMDVSAHVIGLSALDGVLRRDIVSLEPEAQESYATALRAFATVMGVPLNLDVDQLKYIAEVEGYGYKKANLDQVVALCGEGFGAYQLRVPEYIGLSSGAIQEMLRHYGLDLAGEWQAIVEKHFPDAAVREEVFRSKKFPEAFLTDCADLRQKIKVTFDRVNLQEGDISSIGQLFHQPDVDALIGSVAQRNERFMVRSSGREDSKELANAGGNTSVPNVVPNSQVLLQALEEVVTSYFGEKSLKQRLGAEDIALFDAAPLTPAILQRMIGERDPASLPKCGVMFTEDAESAVKNEQDASRTTGITVIESAYGHNEGVVACLIPTDAYYVDGQDHIMPIVRPKTHRMMPTEKSGELQLVANDPQVVATPSLSVEAIITLKNFAERLETFYRGPMDVEFVVDEQEKTIYIVQARPIVHQKNADGPSYVPDVNNLNAAEVLTGSAIGTAGGAVRIAKPSEIICAPTISQALDQYQTCDDPRAIQGIIVGRHAPSTSHWATTFRGEGKPVLYIEDIATVQAWLEDAESQIFLSPQQGIAAKLSAGQTVNREELLASDTCVRGWVDYPAAPHLSVSGQFKPSELLTHSAIKTLCPTLYDPEKWVQFEKYALQYPLQKVLENMSRSQGEVLEVDLAVLLYQFEHALTRYATSLNLDAEQQEKIQTLKSYALALAKSIKENGDVEPSDPCYPRKLLPIHFLHALIYGQSNPQEVVSGHSLATVALREFAAEQTLTRDLTAQGITLSHPYSISLLRLGQVALTPEIAQQYRELVLTLDREKRVDEINRLYQLIVDLNKLGMLSQWLNLAFPRNPDVVALAAGFDSQAAFYQMLSQKAEALNALSISAFSNPKSFAIQWQVFQAELLNFVEDPQFLQALREVDISGKFAAIVFMYDLVDRFDRAIKELEGSEEFAKQTQLALVQQMLQRYCGMARTWLAALDLPMKGSIGACLELAWAVINKSELSPSDLRFAPGFDVSAFESRSGASFARIVKPVTLEDAFSATHRELLTILSQLSQQASEGVIPMPPLMRDVAHRLFGRVPDGVEIGAQGIAVNYSRSLRQHGVQYRLECPTKGDRLTLSARFSAENENGRWDKIIHYMLLLKVFGKFDLTDFDMGSRGLSFTFHLDASDNLDSLAFVLNSVETASTEIAKPQTGAKYDLSAKGAWSIQNGSKHLLPIEDGRKIVQEYERVCGINSMLDSSRIQIILKRLVEIDPAFVESFMKRAWQADIIYSNSDWFLKRTLPEELIKAGHATATICQHALALIDSGEQFDANDAISMLLAVGRNSPESLPAGSTKRIVDVLIKGKRQKQDVLFLDVSDARVYRRAFELLEVIAGTGRDGDQMLQGVTVMLESPQRDVVEDGMKALNMLIDRRQSYSMEFQMALRTIVMELNVEPESKQRLLSRFNASSSSGQQSSS